MSKLNSPISFMDYVLDPATDNSHLWKHPMPKGMRDDEKRKWLVKQAHRLHAMSLVANNKCNETGLAFFASLRDALENESNECHLASKRKYIERTPQ